MIPKSCCVRLAQDSSRPVAQVLAFDVGGSHVSVGLCELENLAVLCQASAPLPQSPESEAFIDLLYRLASEVTAGGLQIPAGAALAMPGPFDYTFGISYMRHKLKPLYGVDLRAALASRFGWRQDQFRFLNDAGAFLLGEIHAGAARGAERAVGITLGTGVGSAFAVDRRLVTTGKGVPPQGEIWNLPYGKGTVEDLLSSRALTCDFAKRTGKETEVIEVAALNSAEARQVFESFGILLGDVVRDILAPFAPQVIVIGGGISRSAQLFVPFARRRLGDQTVRLLTSILFDQAPLVGAAAFWREDIDTVQSSGLMREARSG